MCSGSKTGLWAPLSGTLGVSWEWLWLKPDWEVGPGYQGLGCPGRMFGFSQPALGAFLLSSGWSPSRKPGGRGYCNLSQLSGEAKQHHHWYPGQHLQAVAFGPAEKGAASYKGVYVYIPTPMPPLPHPQRGHGRGSLGSPSECVLHL